MRTCPRLSLVVLTACLTPGVILAACSANSSSSGFGQSGTGGSAGTTIGTGGQGAIFDAGGDVDQDSCAPHCSADRHSILGCGDSLQKSCAKTELCVEAECRDACEAAGQLKSSVGCDYFPVMMQGYNDSIGGCFAVVVANTWSTPAHVQIEYNGVPLNPALFGAIPSGTGQNLEYASFDPAAGIPASQVAIFFLAGPGPAAPNGIECPWGITPAITNANPQVNGTGIGNAFHVTTDIPVVAYQVLPFGGGSASVTGASLLLPTSVWDTNYLAVNAYEKSSLNARPSLNIVAMQDGTTVTMVPRAAVQGQPPGIESTDANGVLTIQLNRGQHAQLTQGEELTGSAIQSTKPIALMAGHECAMIPKDKGFCDHAEQQIPPVRAMGSEYAAVSYRQRSNTLEARIWRILGTVAGTTLSFDPPSAHATATIGLGQVLEFTAADPFVVRSQDSSHPFLVTGYMTGSDTVQAGYGDPDFVRFVPPQQYLQRYVFFTDPTYPETNLVIVRVKGPDGFADVELDCGGTVSEWKSLGTEGRFEYARFDLSRHDFIGQNGCDNGRHEMSSDQPFGLSVWGWGSPETSIHTMNVSYGYPAGESVLQLNDVVIVPTPR